MLCFKGEILLLLNFSRKVSNENILRCWGKDKIYVGGGGRHGRSDLETHYIKDSFLTALGNSHILGIHITGIKVVSSWPEEGLGSGIQTSQDCARSLIFDKPEHKERSYWI